MNARLHQTIRLHELPKRMRTLARDHRGFPIPYIVMIDTHGTPQFTINDVRRTDECRRKRLCAICGKRFDDGMWFVGGSRCFLHEFGAFLDPPVHYECGEYALRICPFLAAAKYSKRIDAAKLPAGGLPEGMALVREEGMTPRLPERFGFGRTDGYEVKSHGLRGPYFYTVPQWDFVEWWQQGERCNAPDSGRPAPEQVING
jgi:hypothetical protein